MKNMNLSIIISWIKEKCTIYYEPFNTDYLFHSIRILEKHGQIMHKNFLYLTDDKTIVANDWTAQCPDMLVLCATPDSETIHKNSSWNSHVLIISTKDSVLNIYNIFQDLFDRYQTWYDNCIDMILNDTELPKLLDYASLYLDNPIALFDQTGILLHQTGTFQQNIEGTIWAEVLYSGFTPTETITPEEHRHIMQRVQEGDKLIPSVFQHDPSHHSITIPLHVDGKMSGAFGMIDINAPFTNAQNALLQDVSRLTELALKHLVQSAILQDEEHYYVTRLLQGFPANNRATAQYLKSKNYKNDDLWYLYLFPVFDLDYAETRKSAYTSRISSVLPNAVILFFENYLIAICRKKDFDPDLENSFQKLNNLLEHLSMNVQISICFTHFTDLYAAYGQCLLMEKYLTNNHKKIQRFDDSYQSILYGILAEKNLLKGFCHPEILSLWESRSEQKRILVYDLKYYLLNGKNIAETSRYLNLHRNTFIYRLHKIEEYLKLSINSLNENMLLYLLLSCMICETLKD